MVHGLFDVLVQCHRKAFVSPRTTSQEHFVGAGRDPDTDLPRASLCKQDRHTGGLLAEGQLAEPTEAPVDEAGDLGLHQGLAHRCSIVVKGVP